MKQKIALTLIILLIVLVTVVYAADVKWSALAELTTIADADILCVIDSGTSKKITVLNFFDTIDTSAELLAIMTNETGTGALVFATSPTLVTPILGTITSGVGTALTALNGENIQDDTIDDDSIDLGDLTGADLTLTDCGAITSTGTITATVGFDIVGAADIDYGSVDVTDHTFITDGTGTGEIVLPAGSIDGTEILDDTIDSPDYAAGSIDDEHVADGALQEPALDITNVGAGLDNYLLSYNHAGTNFTWVVAGAGDMLKATYDSGESGGVDMLTTVDSTYASDYVLLTGTAVGTAAPKTDGALTYDATSGTLGATEFSGGGGSLTAIDAATGDSATGFFDVGTIEHEYGGLQANISGYTGLIAITGVDTTAEIDSLDELEGQLADVTRIVSEAVMPVASTDPDVDAAGELSVDTDGANEPNDVVLRSIDGGNTPLQIALAQQQKSFQATIITPNDLADATRDACPIWSNETGMSFVITKIEAWADTDDTAFNVEVVDADGVGNNATVDAVNCTTGAGPYTATETTITANTIAANRMIFIDFDDTDDPGWVKVSICGYFLSDVD